MKAMIEVTAEARKWGRSIGLVIPKELTKREGIRPGDRLKVLVQKEKKNPLKEMYGFDPSLRPAREILKDIDKEGWNE